MKGPDGYSEEDWLALSGIQHFSILMRTVCAFINLALDMRIGLSVMGVNGVCRLMM